MISRAARRILSLARRIALYGVRNHRRDSSMLVAQRVSGRPEMTGTNKTAKYPIVDCWVREEVVMPIQLKPLMPTTIVLLMGLASIDAYAVEVSAHRTYVCQFQFEASGFLHPNKPEITPADQGINPHRCHGTITVTGLGDGYDNLSEKCEGVRFRNFYVGAKPPNHHLTLGVCTLFRGEERVGTSTYHGTVDLDKRGLSRKLYLASHSCDQTGEKVVEGEGNNAFTETLAPPGNVFLGGTTRGDVIESYNCSAK